MPIERKNSFHLMLSDDEMELLRLLAEREGLNASDYLRTMLRNLAGGSPHVAQIIRLGSLLGADAGKAKASYAQLIEAHRANTAASPAPSTPKRKRKKRAI